MLGERKGSENKPQVDSLHCLSPARNILHGRSEYCGSLGSNERKQDVA